MLGNNNNNNSNKARKKCDIHFFFFKDGSFKMCAEVHVYCLNAYRNVNAPLLKSSLSYDTPSDVLHTDQRSVVRVTALGKCMSGWPVTDPRPQTDVV